MIKIKNVISFRNYLPIYLLIIIIFNIVLIQLPLIKTLGYEFSALNSMLLVLISGFYTISFISCSSTKVNDLIKINLLYLAIPLSISIAYSLFTMFCSFLDGVLFYFLIAFPSIIIGSSLAIFCYLVSERFTKSFFILIFILVASIPVFEIYCNPQVYFYSPLIAYFPGNIYDEALSPDIKLFFYRLLNIIYFLPLVVMYFSYNGLMLKRKKYIITTFILIAILFQFISPYIGFSTTFTSLKFSLTNQIETNNWVIHYDDVPDSEAKFIALNQQYYFEKISTELQVQLNKKINIYVFNSREQKKELFGAGNADVAKPWQYSVYISKDSWKNTLKHELVHVFSAEFGKGIFKLADNFNPALIEGIAEAIDGTSDDISIHNLSALAFNNEVNVNLKNLFTGFNFFKSNSSISYIYAGSFILYLIDKFGIEKVKSFYENGNFNASFKVNFSIAEKDYLNMLENENWFGSKSMSDYYFGRLSIIQKVCPRYISDRLNKGWNYLGELKLDDAERLFEEINTKTLNYQAISGLSEIMLLRKKKDAAINIILKNVAHFQNTPFYYHLKFMLADTYAHFEEIESAKRIYKYLAASNPHRQIYYLAKTRLKLIEENKLNEYILGNDSTKFEILKMINQKIYGYNTIPVLIEAAKAVKIDYKTFLKIFDKTIIVNDIPGSYAMYKLSQFMLENGDYINARKMSSLALRFKESNPFIEAIKEEFEKSQWFIYNADKFLSNIKIKKIS